MLALAEDSRAIDPQLDEPIATPEVAPEVEAEAEAAQQAQEAAQQQVAADPATAAADPATAAADPAAVAAGPAAAATDPKAAIPAVAEAKEAGQEAPAQDATASEQAYGSEQLDRGMYEPEDYIDACQAAGAMNRWDARYADGHTGAVGWTLPYETQNRNSFTLKAGHSASKALKDFITGPTIGDFRVLAVALELDGVRDTLGDQKFDQLFGSAEELVDAKIKPGQRLLIDIDIYTTPFADQMLKYAAEQDEALQHAEAVPEPVQVARVEEKPEEKAEAQPAPEMIAEELGIDRERELA